MKKNESKKIDHKVKKGGARIPNKGSLQAYLQNFGKEAIDKIVWFARHSKNETLKFAANKILVDKSVADLHDSKIDGTITNININRDYVSPRGWIIPTPTGSFEGSNTVQDPGVAQES